MSDDATQQVVVTPDQGLSIKAIITAAVMGLGGFFVSDFVSQRDQAPRDVEESMRELLDLKISPLVKSQNRIEADLNQFGPRLQHVERDVIRTNGEIRSLSDRVDRLARYFADQFTPQSQD